MKEDIARTETKVDGINERLDRLNGQTERNTKHITTLFERVRGLGSRKGTRADDDKPATRSYLSKDNLMAFMAGAGLIWTIIKALPFLVKLAAAGGGP